MAEIELAALSRQCLDRRIPNQDRMRTEIAAWEASRNGNRSKIKWQFTTSDARIKLYKLYTSLQV
jgi:hypothetical protein